MISFEKNALHTYRDVGEVYTEACGARFDNAVLRAIRFRAETDCHDTPVSEKTVYAFRRRIERTEGNIFILSAPTEAVSVVYIVVSPDIALPSLAVEKGELRIVCDGYPVVRGECAHGTEAALCRTWYRTLYTPQGLIAMSNTWGDRGGRDVVTEEFVRREIDCAERLGVDVVQVDDGWQRQPPNTFDEAGLRVFEGNFWDVREEVFPHGIGAITPYATAHGVETGLWFAPHSNGNFAHFDRDLAILKRAYEEWGFHYFKLDMLQLNTHAQCKRATELIEAIHAFGKDATVELDVTADKRLGYLAAAPFGTLFVENRYSAWSNYYPHATLRNLWRLAAYIPASKMQFELLNPTLFTDQYREDDPLRPALYDIDYLFASVMVSNPLFWMEMQRLPEREAERLRAILSVWRTWRDELVRADVSPIGEEPSGATLTGFSADTEEALHLILLREVTDRDTVTVELPQGLELPEVLATNTEAKLSTGEGRLSVTLSAPRSYAWIRLSRKS